MAQRTIAALALLVTLATTSAFAQTAPVWRAPADTITVLSTGSANGLPYAMIRDSALKGHNTFAISVGAHVGKLSVVAIDERGVLLSNGRVLANPFTRAIPNTDVAVGHH